MPRRVKIWYFAIIHQRNDSSVTFNDIRKRTVLLCFKKNHSPVFISQSLVSSCDTNNGFTLFFHKAWSSGLLHQNNTLHYKFRFLDTLPRILIQDLFRWNQEKHILNKTWNLWHSNICNYHQQIEFFKYCYRTVVLSCSYITKSHEACTDDIYCHSHPRAMKPQLGMLNPSGSIFGATCRITSLVSVGCKGTTPGYAKYRVPIS